MFLYRFTKIKNVQAAAFAATLLLSAGARAAEVEEMGYGANSCAKYGEAYKLHPDEAEALYFAWALGYMSGMNMTARAFNRVARNLAATSQDEQRRFLRQWCDAHPMANYSDGVFELLKTLPEVSH